MKRIFVVLMLLPLFVISSFAWSKYSFIDSLNVYRQESVDRFDISPFSLRTSSVSSLSGDSFVSLLSPAFDFMAIKSGESYYPSNGDYTVTYTPDGVGNLRVNAIPSYGTVPSSFVFNSLASSSSGGRNFDFSFDVSAFSGLSSFSLSGGIYLTYAASLDPLSLYLAESLQLLVNGSVVHTFSPYESNLRHFPFNDYSYSSSSYIDSIVFRFVMPEVSVVTGSGNFTGGMVVGYVPSVLPVPTFTDTSSSNPNPPTEPPTEAPTDPVAPGPEESDLAGYSSASGEGSVYIAGPTYSDYGDFAWADTADISFTGSSPSLTFPGSSGTVEVPAGGSGFSYLCNAAYISGSVTFTYTYDQPLSSLELSGRVSGTLAGSLGGRSGTSSLSGCSVVINDTVQEVAIGDGIVDFNNFIYDGAGQTFDSFSIAFSFHSTGNLAGSLEPGKSYSSSSRITLNPEDFSIFTIASGGGTGGGGSGGSDIINSEIEQGRDSLVEHDRLEDDWGGSMVDNFNALDLENFEAPTDLIGSFALISGIFQDIWSSFGAFQVLFLLPLILGIVLLVIGRKSKFVSR